MKNNQNIEEIFKETLRNHESSVDPSLWTNISQSIGSGAASTVATTTVVKLTLLKITSIVAGVIALGTVIYFVSQEDSQVETVQVEETKIEAPEESELTSTEVVNSDNTDTKEDSILELTAIVDDPDQKKEDSSSEDSYTNLETTTDSGSETLGNNDLVTSPSYNPEELDTSSPLNDPTTNDNDFEEILPEEEIILDPIDAQFTHLLISHSDDLIFRFKGSTQDNVQYEWSFGDGNYSLDQIVEHEYESQGDYTVTLTIIRGDDHATSSAVVKAYLEPTIEIADIFTPNQDLLNQYFDVMAGSKNVELDQLNIYSSANIEVFKNHDGQYMWDGLNYDGSLCEEGYYLYTVRFIASNGEVLNKMGRVYLKRN